MRAKRIFDNLFLAAGLNSQYRFGLDLGDGGAYYRPSLKTVFLTLGFLRKYGDQEGVVMRPLAHELAHALQHRDGFLIASSHRLFTWHFTSQQIEAHADMIGAQIAARAGYSPELFLEGMQKYLTCEGIKSGSDDKIRPSDGDRWVNILNEKPRLAAERISTLVQVSEMAERLNKSPEDAYRHLERTFSGEAVSGSVKRAREENPFSMRVTPGYFDEHGRAPITGLAINSIPDPEIPGTLPQDSKSQDISLGRARQAVVNSLMKGSWGDGWVRRLAAQACGAEFDGTFVGAVSAGLVKTLIPAKNP